MAIAFTYDESDNKVVVTGGTSGTPATFAGFVTADRAGTAELTPEDTPDACTTNMTLTYQIRPVEDLALQITFTLAGTSAGAGDTLDITGTDWRGAAQNESIDVAAGDGAYTGAKYWRTITDIDCTGWADGTLKVTQPRWGVIWDYGQGNYQIDCFLDFGDDSTSTYFQSTNEYVYFSNGSSGEWEFFITNNATLEIGTLSTAAPINGSTWRVGVVDTYWPIMSGDANAVFKLYGSTLMIDEYNGNEYIYFRSGTVDIRNSTITKGIDGSGSVLVYFDTSVDLSIRGLYSSGLVGITIGVDPTICENLTVGYHSLIGIAAEAISGTATGVNIIDTVSQPVRISGGTSIDFNVVDPLFTVENVVIGNAGSVIYEKYTINIHVTDKNGEAIPDTATVACTRANVVTESAKFYKCIEAHTSGTFATDLAAGKWEEITDSTIIDAAPAWLTTTSYVSEEAVFSENPTDGSIAEQTVTVRKWTGTSELETKYIFDFTITETGYLTQIKDNTPITGAVDWRLVMLRSQHPVAPWQEGMM